MSCPQCEGLEMIFDEESVEDELRIYRAEGLDQTTQWLIEALQDQGVEGLQLLDIGGGLGGIQHALLERGAAGAVHVDASTAYIDAAQREAQRRGLAERIQWRHGDFVDLAPELDSADIVTLDRVICCYPDMPEMVGASLRLARRFYGLVLPKDNWLIGIWEFFGNLFQRIMRHPYRMYMHPNKEIDALVAAAGFNKLVERRTLFWRVALFAR
jgi:magnesium-protoporphyrin O-methyltransferase